jgi:hypothetical protein
MWTKEQHAIYMREWRKSHRESVYNANKKWRKNNKKSVAGQSRRYRENHPDLVSLRKNAQNKAKLISLKDKCELCGSKAEEKHHPDYLEPYEVMHLCKGCHRTITNKSFLKGEK